MEASCTYVANSAWIGQAVFLSALTVAFTGSLILANLRARRIAAEGGNEGTPDPEASLATA